MVVDTTRLAWVDEIQLASGTHRSPDHGACVMEAVAYVAGEPWSDHPACASQVLGVFLRSWNDALDPETRQRLKPLVPRLVGTAGDGALEARRAWMATDWLVRVCAPAFLDLAGLAVEAESFRQLPELDGADAARNAQETLDAGRNMAAAAWAAAGDAAWDAPWAAAWAAAWSAAGAAAWDAAWAAARAAAEDAAWGAVWAAARAAAWDAVWAAAWGAARGAPWAALQPTVTELQESAFDLVQRMIEVQ